MTAESSFTVALTTTLSWSACHQPCVRRPSPSRPCCSASPIKASRATHTPPSARSSSPQYRMNTNH
eukprot:14740893-Heterocapsa_arctica.AAC.1